MDITVAQPSRFKRMFEVLKELYNDLEIQFDQDGFGFRLVDKTTTCFGHLKVDNRPEHFPVYQLKKPVKICINVAQFCTVLHPLSNDHTLRLKVPDEQIDQPQELIVFMEDMSQSDSDDFMGDKRSATIKLSNPEQEDSLEGENLVFEKTVQIDSNKLRSYIGDLAGMSERVTVTIGDTNMQLYCQSDRLDYHLKIGCKPIVTQGQPALPSTDGKGGDLPLSAGERTGVYALRYMKLFVKAQDLSGKVLLSLSNEGIMLWRFEMKDYGLLQFFLAPISTEPNMFGKNQEAPEEEELLV